MLNKKGIILHPVTWIIGSFIIGLVVAFLAAKGFLGPGLGSMFCGGK